ncbi:unnamed protein product, partial [Darwinula stevensoni]
KTVLNESELAKEFIDKTPNWDVERIAELDTIILKMAICEFLKFPSIPLKVTINEYLELAKEYSTPKSSLFINGILDNLLALMFGVLYLFMILPQQRKAKKEKEFESSLKVGDKIITKSGFHGKIAELAETTVVIETMSGKLKMEKSAISLDMSAALNKKA